VTTKKYPIKRILIANRGEIAVRIIRACREMDICAVAVFSDVDRKSLHVVMADEAYPLGGSTPAQSYLNQEKILQRARMSNVDAIHPGYGFLAENPSFAKRVEEEGLRFIGPSSKSISLMGDKTEARRTARKLGIPTISGTADPIQDEGDGLRFAVDIGFPILLKAAAGGGGKGMRTVRSSEEFPSSFRSAQSEAKTAFGDERVYIEKFLEAPRHIEVQILADAYGNTIYLGERECSIQRRHQKVIEESPSTAVDQKLRKTLGEAAVALAKAASYANAGTIEFLLDQQHNFYFLEMNTRLQVEHPVTEAITGIDLVKEQIRVAEGQELRINQSDIKLHGHAIECRICAEDPENNFLPSTGSLLRYQPPEGKIRVENGFRQGDELSVYYDSLLSKVISWGTTRDEAIASMKRALSEFAIEGVKSTIPFCQFVLDHDAFRTGDFDTQFVEKHFSRAQAEIERSEEKLAAVILAVLLTDRQQRLSSAAKSDGLAKSASQWKSLRKESYRS
jgi:propionyl-CoA carboxylase alpha chain